MSTPAFRRILAAIIPSWSVLYARGMRMQTTWRVEWTWNSDGTVTLDTSQSDTMGTVGSPAVESVGPGSGVALGARINVRFPPSGKAWVVACTFLPVFSELGANIFDPIVGQPDANQGLVIVNMTNPGQLSNPDESSRCRLVLLLEDIQ